ncbi:integrase arm-type DNA-binding domain-containing protein [Hafnia paralvei]|uniref:integrase arm-type DNA-binding domain-containing protein n=1 Tax=Hafnia paralvei TaxID=546367 RepID=UPI001D0FB62E|nr:integrase arm-type DNA-binding domain-containing protein [Hafnia paralvei]
MLTLGVYPEVTLSEARRRRDEARQLVAHDVDPSEKRKAEASNFDYPSYYLSIVLLGWRITFESSKSLVT